jgi:LacI family transcriptional regulator
MNKVPTVDPELVDRVRAAAAQLGYRTNGVARSLRRQRTDVWALIISDIGNPFFTSLARGVEDIAQRAGFSVVLCNSDEDPAKEAQYLDVAEREQVSGVILSPNIFGSDISRLIAANISVVAVDRPLREPVDSVLVHSRDGARAATTHLLDEGWSRPACITGPARADTSEQRLTGYLDALGERKWRTARRLIRHTDYRADSARQAVASLLDERTPPDSFFVANSSMALGVLEEFANRGIRPGEDVGLIAFDDAPWAPFVNPPMSVVAQPSYEIGTRAGELLLDRIRGEPIDSSPQTVTLSTTLVLRASSRKSLPERRQTRQR